MYGIVDFFVFFLSFSFTFVQQKKINNPQEEKTAICGSFLVLWLFVRSCACRRFLFPLTHCLLISFFSLFFFFYRRVNEKHLPTKLLSDVLHKHERLILVNSAPVFLLYVD